MPLHPRILLPLLSTATLLIAALFLSTSAHAANCTQSSESHSDPNAGQSWSVGWHCGNDSGAPMYLGTNNSTQDSAVRRGLIQRWKLGSDEFERLTIKLILARNPSAETSAFARELLDSNDAAQRRDGFELLLGVPADKQTLQAYDRLAQSLGREQDPSVVATVVATLAKSNATPAIRSETPIEQLRALSQNPDNPIRAASLRALSLQDAGTRTDSALKQALTDPQEEIRLAAACAIGADARRAQSMQSELIGIAYNTDETRGVRYATLDALRPLQLTDAGAVALGKISRELKAR